MDPAQRGMSRGRAVGHRMAAPGFSRERAPLFPAVERIMERFHIEEGAQETVSGEVYTPAVPSTSTQAGTGPTDPASSSHGGEGEGEERDPFMRANDILVTKPPNLVTKRGAGGTAQKLVSNYFYVQLKRNVDWRLQQYRVDVEPEQDSKIIRKALVRKGEEQMPVYIYDGGSFIYSHGTLPTDPFVTTPAYVHRDTGKEDVYKITIKHVKEISCNKQSRPLFQFFNILLRKSLEAMQLGLIGRYYYDHKKLARIPEWRLEIIPGYKTCMRCHDRGVLLNVEMVSKVTRMGSVLDIMRMLQEGPREELRQRIYNGIVGHVVITAYNFKSYKVEDIDWATKVTDTFPTKKGPIRYVDYYEEKYGKKIGDLKQPLLVCMPTKRDIHRGDVQNITLIPELCQMTGLTEEMRSNFNLMKALKNHLIQDPAKRVEELQAFMLRLMSLSDLKEDMAKWGVRYPSADLVEIDSRMLVPEQIMFANNKAFSDDQEPSDWSKAFRNQKLYRTVGMQKWAILVTNRDVTHLDNLVRTIQKVSTPMGFLVGNPIKKVLGGIGSSFYTKAIQDVMDETKGDLQMIFIILPNNALPLYAAVKQKCAVSFGVPSQCFLAKNAVKSNMSVCTKVAIQMCVKVGGEPWIIRNPLSKANLMVIGYDVYHSGGDPNMKTSVGAMVATMNPEMSRYSSLTTFGQKNELGTSLGSMFSKLVGQYKKLNGKIPDRIIFYRDGVGEGQLGQCLDVELSSVQKFIEMICQREGIAEAAKPKLVFVVVSKRITTRFLLPVVGRAGTTYHNPPPGTVVDSVVTLPERYDFFLVSQLARQGTVSPTSYNVIYDDQPSFLTPTHLQMLTFKLCHMYYNWSGTVAVPAVCQYAHKLAFLTGTALIDPIHSNLQNLLHFL